MNFIERNVGPFLLRAFNTYPIVTLTGPRQAGKSTLLKKLFPELEYVNFENLNTRSLAKESPEGFLKKFPKGVIFDEVQRLPELFSEIQVHVDNNPRPGQFILSGSQNFLLLESISQSLAGRTALFHLLPFSQVELGSHQQLTLEKRIFYGGYPRIHDQSLDPMEWIDDYIQTFVERDIRTLKNVLDLEQFRLFIRMCAARSGQILDLAGLGNDCGIASNTAKAWLSLLETSFITFRVIPFFKNYNKRLIKSPKIFFWDTGLLCFLLGIRSAEEIQIHSSRGAIFETYVISELRKQILNQRKKIDMYYWRDKYHEIDCLLSLGPDKLLPIEIKSASKFNADFKNSLTYFKKLSNHNQISRIIYAGDQSMELDNKILLTGIHEVESGYELFEG